MDEELNIDFVVDSIALKQDIGGPYPSCKHVRLLLWNDGSVTWDTKDGVTYDE